MSEGEELNQDHDAQEGLGESQFQPSQCPPTQWPFGDPRAPQHIVPFAAQETCPRSNKNWSKEEDIQLTVAWDMVSTNRDVGVGQKRGRVWQRVLQLFQNLMNEKHGMKQEDNVRNIGGCENRMTEIKAQCSRWTAVRARALAQKHSGWSAGDMEKLCHVMHEAEGKGPFKWEECWKVLSGNPKFQDYMKKSGKGHPSSAQQATRQPHSPPAIVEPILIDTTSDNMETQTPVTPMTEVTRPEPEVGCNSRGTGTPNLDGAASVDIERPIGMKKSKNQRQRRIRQYYDAQSAASRSFTAGLMSLQAETTSRWEKLEEADRMRDLKDDERYDEMMRMQALEHEMKMASSRSEIAEQRGVIGQKLLDAIQKLDQIDPLSLVTNAQRMVYDVKKKAVEDYQESYDALGEMLKKLKYISPRSAPPPEENNGECRDKTDVCSTMMMSQSTWVKILKEWNKKTHLEAGLAD